MKTLTDKEILLVSAIGALFVNSDSQYDQEQFKLIKEYVNNNEWLKVQLEEFTEREDGEEEFTNLMVECFYDIVGENE